MTLNTAADIIDLNEILSKIVNNILGNPSDQKFRELKFSYKTIQSRIISRKGGFELLQLFGFIASVKDGEKVLILEISTREQEDLVFQNLNQSLEILRSLFHKAEKLMIILKSIYLI